VHRQLRQKRCEAAQLVYIRWIGIMLGREREEHTPSRLNGIKILTTHEGSPILRLDDQKDEVQMRLQYGQNCRPRVNWGYREAPLQTGPKDAATGDHTPQPEPVRLGHHERQSRRRCDGWFRRERSGRCQTKERKLLAPSFRVCSRVRFSARTKHDPLDAIGFGENPLHGILDGLNRVLKPTWKERPKLAIRIVQTRVGRP